MTAWPHEAPMSVTEPGCFVALPENRAARLALGRVVRGLANQRRARFPLLFLHGPPGAGKSRLLRELVDRTVELTPLITARLVAARDLAGMIARPGADREFLDCDLLLIDDIQHLPATGARDLERLLDQRSARGQWQVATATTGPALLKHLSRRLISRLGAGLVVRVEPLRERGRRRFARELCKENGVAASPALIAWLARPASASPRRMFSDLRHALRWSRDGKTLDAEAFAALSDADDAPIERLDRLLARVARHYGVTVPRMKKRDRRRSLLWPRQVGMYLVRQASGWSLPRVGAYFGGFDHTTVGHACRQVEARIAATVGLARELDELLELSG